MTEDYVKVTKDQMDYEMIFTNEIKCDTIFGWV